MAAKQVIFCTGANTGLGYEIMKALMKSETAYNIFLGSRSVEKGEAALSSLKHEVPSSPSTVEVVQIDVTSDESIQKAYNTTSSKFDRVDVLINNAGQGFDRQIQAGKMTTREGWNTSWDVNVTGAEIVTTTFVPLLLKSSDPRLMFLTSGTASLSETERFDGPMFQRLNGSPSAGWPKSGDEIIPVYSYRSTKVGLNMMMREWHRRLKNDGVKVWSISPGFLATGLAGVGAEQLRKMGARDPSIGGEFIRDVVQGKRDGDAGKVIRENMIQPW